MTLLVIFQGWPALLLLFLASSHYVSGDVFRLS